MAKRSVKTTKKGLLKYANPDISCDKTRPEPELISFLGNLNERGKLLDIGCGIGLESDYAQNLGFDVIALDKNYGCIRKAKELNSKVNFKQVDFFNYIKKIGKNEFKVIVDSKFSNKLTLGKLKRYYRKISKVLDYGSYMYLQVLSTDDEYCKKHCPIRKWTKVEENYIRYFSKKDILKLLDLTGLKVESMKTIKQKEKYNIDNSEHTKEETYHIIIAKQIVKKW